MNKQKKQAQEVSQISVKNYNKFLYFVIIFLLLFVFILLTSRPSIKQIKTQEPLLMPHLEQQLEQIQTSKTHVSCTCPVKHDVKPVVSTGTCSHLKNNQNIQAPVRGTCNHSNIKNKEYSK